MVRAWTADTSPCERAIWKLAKVVAAATSPAGMAKRSTRGRNPDLARRGFGARARKKPGMPMVSAEMSVKWRGMNGNGRRPTPVARARSMA